LNRVTKEKISLNFIIGIIRINFSSNVANRGLYPLLLLLAGTAHCWPPLKSRLSPLLSKKSALRPVYSAKISIKPNKGGVNDE
jgi:hypothetical protein